MGARSKNMLLGDDDRKDYLTGDELVTFQQEEQEPNDIISKQVDIPRRERAANPVNVMPTRNADGEKVEWKSPYTPSDEDKKDIAARTGNLAKNVKEWLAGSQDATTSGATATTAATPKAESYEEMMKYFKAQAGMNADAEKRQRRNELFSSIGDGISALSSLYQTTQGAPVTYTHGDNMTSELRDRYDRLLKSRAASNEQYLNYLKAKRQMELDADTRWWREQNLEETRRWHDMNKQTKEDAAEKKAETDAKKAEQKDKVIAQGDRRLDQKDKEIAIKQENKGKSSSSKSGTKKGKQKKKAPKKKARDNASSQSKTSSGNTAPAMRK